MATIRNSLVPGQIVRSKAGHDKGDIFFVVGVLDDEYVLIADGGRRKKVKHLQPYNRINETIAEVLSSGKRVENIDLQRELEKVRKAAADYS